MLKEYREFAIKGNVIDLAVGVVIGGAFGAIVTSLVKDVVMPPIGLLTGKVDFNNQFLILKEGTAPGPYATVDEAHKVGAVTMNYGAFINTLISFLIVSFCIFLVIKAINRMKRKEEEAPATPPEPTKEEILLTEIRDLLRDQKA